METKRVEFITVEYGWIEKKIQDHFKRPDYSIVADEEWDNDSQHAFYDIDGTGGYIYNFPADVVAFKEGKRHGSYLLRDLLHQLAADGVIEKGSYLISVSW